MDLIKVAEQAFLVEKTHPEFKAGDTVTVAYRIIEGSKERIQEYRGDVIKIVGHEGKKRFTVRKMSGNIGVERIFPLDSPFIESIAVKFVALNCIIYVHLLVKKQESKNVACNRKLLRRNKKKRNPLAGFLFFLSMRYWINRNFTVLQKKSIFANCMFFNEFILSYSTLIIYNHII